MVIIVTTYPFNTEYDEISQLTNAGHEIIFNEYKRKMSATEIRKILIKYNPDIIIAGTENYNKSNLDLAPNLKMISRVGIGMDSIDIDECRLRNIVVTNTPDAPSNAVAELTIGQMLNGLRRLTFTNNKMKDGQWNRFIGKDIKNCKIGVIGCGRIGSRVINKLKSLSPEEIYVYDINNEAYNNIGDVNYKKSNKQEILKNCDIITLHIPLNLENVNYITKHELSIIKDDGIIINTSRGGIINEEDLYQWLLNNPNNTGIIDVFENEPYNGKMIILDNCILSPHLGSCTIESRYLMERGSIINVLKYLEDE